MNENQTETWEERQAREKSEAAAATRALFHYAAGIVHELGSDVWELTPTTGDSTDYETRIPHIRRKTDGANFDISTSQRDKARLYVSGNWPKDATGTEQRPYFSQYSEFGNESPSITLARSKTTVQAARDIARRFLPAFLPMWEKQAATVGHWDDNRAKRTNLAQTIAGLLGGVVRGPRDKRDSTPATVSLRSYDRGITNVEFDHNDHNITVKIRCTLDELKQLAALFPPKNSDAE